MALTPDTINQLNSELIAVENDIRELVDGFKTDAVNAAKAKAAHEIKRAKTLIEIANREKGLDRNSRSTEIIRDALATEAAEIEYLNYKVTTAIADAGRESLRALQAVLTSIQTRARLMQTEANVSGYEPFPAASPEEITLAEF